MASEWRKHRIKDVVSFVVDNRGKTPPTQDEGHILLEVNAVSATEKFPLYQEVRKHVSQEVYGTRFRKGHPKKGDILVPTVGTLGAVSLMDRDDCCIAQNLIAIRCDETTCHSHFLYYVLCNPMTRKRLLNLNIGGVQPSIKVPHLMELEIELPSIGEQKKIAELLSLLDDKIWCNKRINDNLQQQVATIFHQWFVANPESEKWPLVTLDSLTSLVSRGIAPKYTDDSVQIVLNQKCIRDHYIDVSLARRHNPKVINEKWLQYGDLLINSTGEGTLGRAAQVWFVPDNMTVDSHVTIVRPKGPHLLFYIGLWGISHEREIEALHTGSTGQTELPRERVKAMELRLPDNDTLARFNAVIAPIVSLIITNQQENVRLSSIRDALLPKLMSGEIDVSDIQL